MQPACNPALWKQPIMSPISLWLSKINDNECMEQLIASFYHREEKFHLPPSDRGGPPGSVSPLPIARVTSLNLEHSCGSLPYALLGHSHPLALFPWLNNPPPLQPLVPP